VRTPWPPSAAAHRDKRKRAELSSKALALAVAFSRDLDLLYASTYCRNVDGAELDERRHSTGGSPLLCVEALG